MVRFIRPLAIVACMALMVRAAQAQTPLRSTLVASGLARPLFVTHAPGDFQRIFIVEQSGRIKIRKNGQILSPEFLNVDPISGCCLERGLLGLAFHPDYDQNGFFYINYTTSSSPGSTVIARYSVSASNPDTADPTSGQIVLMFSQPQVNHNGGWIGFGPDGYLYIASGDGGGQNDSEDEGHAVGGNGQDITSKLLGKILRIDVNGDDFPADALRNYAIPPDNPFVGVDGDDEIWAYGLRNPWRCAFDRDTGDLYIADVGQNAMEEVNFQPADAAGGRNYGWRCMEGTLCTGLTGCTCNDPSLILPIHEYENSQITGRCSITGGEVYRGCAIPDLSGAYFLADYCTSEIWSLRYDQVFGVSDFADRTTELDPVGSAVIRDISSFGSDAAGEMYVCDLFGGEVFKIVPDAPFNILQSDPPADAIDARRPIHPESLQAEGFDQIRWTLDPAPPCLTPLDIAVVQQGDPGSPPLAEAVDLALDGVVSIQLGRVISPKSWTTIRHPASNTGVRIGSLPGDVSGDRISDESDVGILAAVLDHAEDSVPAWTTDIDRSSLTTPADLVELIDLLNGAGAYDVYFGATLP